MRLLYSTWSISGTSPSMRVPMLPLRLIGADPLFTLSDLSQSSCLISQLQRQHCITTIMNESYMCLAFAEELLFYIGKHTLKIKDCFYEIEIPTDLLVKHNYEFVPVIVSAIVILIDHRKRVLYECARDLQEEKRLPSEKYYSRIVLQALPNFFPDGYSPEMFLAYCAMVTGVCMYLMLMYKIDVSKYASRAVSTALIGFMLSNEFQEKGGFDRLRDISIAFASKKKIDWRIKKKINERSKVV